MDILDKMAIEIPCAACGGRYELSLKQVMLSQEMIHEGCQVQDKGEKQRFPKLPPLPSHYHSCNPLILWCW
jgi:hypothetical protein